MWLFSGLLQGLECLVSFLRCRSIVVYIFVLEFVKVRSFGLLGLVKPAHMHDAIMTLGGMGGGIVPRRSPP